MRSRRSVCFEWIEERDAERFEIPRISCGSDQTVSKRGGGYHSVFRELSRASVHQACPYTERFCIHRQHRHPMQKVFEPALDFKGFCRIAVTSALDARLYFSNCRGSYGHCRRLQGVYPIQHSTVWPLPSQFGYDVRVE